MDKRKVAAWAALAISAVLFAALVFVPLPYVSESPGQTFNVLGTRVSESEDGKSRESEIVQVNGAKAYRDAGELLMVTVSLTRNGYGMNALEIVNGWLDDEINVYPSELIYGEDETLEETQRRSQLQMTGSKEAAEAVALRALGHDVDETVVAQTVFDGTPAVGKIEPGDEFVRVGGEQVTSARDVIDGVESTPAGESAEFVIRRGKKKLDVSITPEETDGSPKIGVGLGVSDYDFPFEVEVNIPEYVGGPSAGLVFSLAIYDTLTKGALAGKHRIAGTGEIASGGKVGPIGGIVQKIASARDSGAELFLVPADNCADIGPAKPGTMELVRADNFDGALKSIKQWVKDPDVNLPRCEQANE